MYDFVCILSVCVCVRMSVVCSVCKYAYSVCVCVLLTGCVCGVYVCGIFIS